MRRIAASIAMVAAALCLSTGPVSAGEPATLVVTPNPVAVGADITVTNASDPASLCEGGGHVDVFFTQPDGSMSSPIPGPTPDEGGNWQYVTQFDEAGEYVVSARCNGGPVLAAEQDGPFRYTPVDLRVGDGTPPPPGPPDPGPPLILVPEPEPLTPSFTG